MFFKTSLGLTLLLLVPVLVFGRLGLWQLERKAEKEQMFEAFEYAAFMPVEQAMLREELFARVEASGRYDASRHILLDNKILEGRAGVHVLTPFYLRDGTVVLVNRGWLPMAADRLTYPAVPTSEAARSIRGRLNVIPTDGLRIGEADVLEATRWPQLVTWLDPDLIGNALGERLAPWLVQLDAGDPTGFEGRHWRAAVMGPEVHGAYAFQWFSLMAAAFIIWLVLGFRRARQQAGQN